MLLRSLWLYTFTAATVFAAPVPTTKYKRDLVTIQAALNTINSALQSLDNSVKATQTVTLGGGIQLLNAVTNVKRSIEDATPQVQASEILNRKDALNLKAATDALTNNVKVTINDVVSKKSLVDSLGATPLVAVALQDQKSASVALAQALVSKVPLELNADAQKSAGALSSVLDQGIAVFGGTSVAAPVPPPGSVGAGSTVCQAVVPTSFETEADTTTTTQESGAGGGGDLLSGLMSMFPPLFKKHEGG